MAVVVPGFLAIGPSASPQRSRTAARAEDPVGALERDFAAWRVDTLTRDDGPASTRSLLGLLDRGEQLIAEAPEDARRGQLLGQLYRARLDLLERVADLRGRLRLLAVLSDAAASSLRDTAPLAVARGRAAAAILKPGELEACIAQLASAGERALQGGAESELLELTVAGALAAGEEEFVRQLGQDAVPALTALATRPRAPEPGKRSDPLVVLAKLAPRRALDVALRLVDERGAIGRARVLTAFQPQSPFAADAPWMAKEGGWVLAEPRWAEILTKLVATDPSRTDLDPWIAEFVRRNYAPPKIAALLPDWVGRGDSAPEPVSPVALRAAEELFQTAEGPALVRAIECILRGPDASSLWTRPAIADTPAREVYELAFGPRYALPWGRTALDSNGRPLKARYVPVPNARFAPALVEFATTVADDNSLHALEGALEVAGERGEPVLGRGALEACIAAAPVVEVQWTQQLVRHAVLLPVDDRNSALAAMARRIIELRVVAQREPGGNSSGHDDAAAVRQILVTTAEQAGTGGFLAALEALDGAVAATHDSSTVGLTAQSVRLALASVVPRFWSKDPTRYAELVRARLLGGSIEVLSELVEDGRGSGRRPRSFLPQLPPALLKDLVRALAEHDFERLRTLDNQDFPLASADWLGLASTANCSAESRQWLLARLADADGPKLDPGQAGSLARAMVRAQDSVIAYHEIDKLGIPSQEVLRALLEPGVATDEFLCGFYAPIEDPELLDRVLARLPPSSWAKAREVWLHRAILRALADRKDPALHPLMLAANRPGTTLQAMLIEALEQVRSPVHAPVAGEVLVTGRFRTREFRDRAIDLVVGVPGDEAGDYLLRAKRSWADANGREALEQAFNQLVTWQEAQQRWLRGKGQAARRVEAVAELATLLAHPQPERRAAGLRGLAALGAVEELPRIIERFDDPAPAVQQAARAAFERLTK